MTIGHIVKLTNKEKGENYKEWLQLIIEPPFMGRLSTTMFENKNKNKDNEPDFFLYENITKRGDKDKFGGFTFKARQIGAVWRRVSKDGKTNFLALSIDTPLVYGGKFNFSAFQSKAVDEAVEQEHFWLYDCVWKPYKANNNNSSYYNNGDYAEPVGYTKGANGDIPVYVENSWEHT